MISANVGWLSLALAIAAPAAAGAQSMPGTGGTGGTGGMEMGAMMRPDAAPPAGIAGGMYPARGRIMPAFGVMHMEMEGNRDGTDSVGTAEVLRQFPVAPLAMDMDMVMGGVMYGVTDDVSVMAMLPYVWKSMPHVTRTGRRFETRSEGVGDVALAGTWRVWREGGHSLALTAGLSLPTGSTDERDATPAGPDQVLPYPMQIGSGTVDLLPGLTYTGHMGGWSWGGQARAAIRLGQNDEGYALGNAWSGSVWGARRLTGWLSASARLTGEAIGDIDGADRRLNPAVVPTADPTLRAGEVLSLGLGLNLIAPFGPARGTRLAIEGTLPVFQRLDGPQVERDFSVMARLSRAF